MLLPVSFISKKCCPSFLIFAAHEWIDSIISINNVSVSLSFWSVSSEYIQEKTQVCKFKTQIIKKTKLMTHISITQAKEYLQYCQM